MKRNIKNKLCLAIGMLAAFIVWTILIRIVDVRAIGPCGSVVGFGALNGYFHTLTGENMLLYTVTDWLGLVPIAVALLFAVKGALQIIKRKSIFKVDRSILALGIFYIAVIFVYIIFEKAAVNYRPVLIDGILEASYPSSTTMLAMCVMPAAALQTKERIKTPLLRQFTVMAIYIFTAFMVVGRILSGVHWITDIIGGALVSTGLVMMYDFAVQNIHDRT